MTQDNLKEIVRNKLLNSLSNSNSPYSDLKITPAFGFKKDDYTCVYPEYLTKALQDAGFEVIKADFETREIGLMLFGNSRNHFFGCNTQLLRFKHDRCAVGIIGTDKVNVMPAHALKTNPDISLDMFQHMSEMNRTVGVR